MNSPIDPNLPLDWQHIANDDPELFGSCGCPAEDIDKNFYCSYCEIYTDAFYTKEQLKAFDNY